MRIENIWTYREYIPVLSTLALPIDLFAQYVWCPVSRPERSFPRILICAIPVLGNLTFIFYDFFYRRGKPDVDAPTTVSFTPDIKSADIKSADIKEEKKKGVGGIVDEEAKNLLFSFYCTTNSMRGHARSFFEEKLSTLRFNKQGNFDEMQKAIIEIWKPEWESTCSQVKSGFLRTERTINPPKKDGLLFRDVVQLIGSLLTLFEDEDQVFERVNTYPNKETVTAGGIVSLLESVRELQIMVKIESLKNYVQEAELPAIKKIYDAFIKQLEDCLKKKSDLIHLVYTSWKEDWNFISKKKEELSQELFKKEFSDKEREENSIIMDRLESLLEKIKKSETSQKSREVAALMLCLDEEKNKYSFLPVDIRNTLLQSVEDFSEQQHIFDVFIKILENNFPVLGSSS